jgi:pimeloyl-ACP methyl ester carboxylesterase
MTVSSPIPFEVQVDQGVVDRIRSRLADALWTACPDDDENWVYGTDSRWLHGLVEHWLHRYDWRAAEAGLNRWPQFKVDVQGVCVHFYHVRSSSSRRRPLLLTHGWPGSVVEFLGCIERLAHPERSGGQAEDGFDLVIPSLPGYGFSGRPARPIGPRAVAGLWRSLMVDVLGYQSFVAQGGDWGAAVTSWLAIDHADVTDAIHLNMVPSWSIATPAEPSPEEATYFGRLATLRAQEMGYFAVQSTRPQTLALALADSPLGFAAWVLEKFRNWGDTGKDIDLRFDRNTLITNLMTYLVNGSVGPALWMYRGRAKESPPGSVQPRVDIPVGVSVFPFEMIPYPPMTLAMTAYNVVRWTPMPAGGHFAALEEPASFSAELGAFCRQIGY